MTADSDGVGQKVQNELRVSMLGALAATVDGQELTLGPPRQRAVLAVLAMRANHVVSRSELIDAVWPDDPPAACHRSALQGRVTTPPQPEPTP